MDDLILDFLQLPLMSFHLPLLFSLLFGGARALAELSQLPPYEEEEKGADQDHPEPVQLIVSVVLRREDGVAVPFLHCLGGLVHNLAAWFFVLSRW